MPLVIFAGAAEAAAISVADDTGRTVTIPGPAMRIVSLAPHLTELLFSLGIGDRVVATAKYSDYPPEAKDIVTVSDAFAVDLELLVQLEPDLVIAWQSGGAKRSVEKIVKMQLPVYFNEAPTLEAIAGSAVRMAKLAGVEPAGRALAGDFLDGLRRLERQYAKARRLRVFYQIADERLYTVNGEHFIGQALSLCAGENIFANVPIRVPEVNLEAIIAADPEVIVYGANEGQDTAGWTERWLQLDRISAVAGGDLYRVTADTLTRPSFRILEGTAELCGAVAKARGKR